MIAIVKEHLDKIQPVDLLKVALSQIQRKRLDLGATEGQGGPAVGGEIDVSAEHQTPGSGRTSAGRR